MRLSVDRKADAAYIYIVDEIRDGEVATTIPAECPAGHGYVFLDFDADGRLLGIELLGAERLLPKPTDLRGT